MTEEGGQTKEKREVMNDLEMLKEEGREAAVRMDGIMPEECSKGEEPEKEG